MQGLISEPYILLTDMKAIGVDQQKLIDDLKPHFNNISPDLYDIRLAKVRLLQKYFPNECLRLENFFVKDGYYRGEIGLDSINDLISKLTSEQREIFETITYTRYQAFSDYCAKRGADDWELISFPKSPYIYRQASSAALADGKPDFRQEPRVYPSLPSAVINHPEVLKFLLSIADIVGSIRSDIIKMNMQFILTRTIARPGRVGSPTPEGRHKDGADFIVSAAVIERKNVTGGKSRIYSDSGNLLLECELQPGEFILQDDQSLSHDVTSLSVSDVTKEGTRDVLGVTVTLV